MDKIVKMVFDLMNEYDIGLWERIRYIDLADFWCSQIVDQKIYDDETLKRNLKTFLQREVEEMESEKEYG